MPRGNGCCGNGYECDKNGDFGISENDGDVSNDGDGNDGNDGLR